MSKLTPDQIAKLSLKVDHFIQLELGQTLPVVVLLVDPGSGGLAFFTNRKSNHEVKLILETALEALGAKGDKFIAVEGNVVGKWE